MESVRRMRREKGLSQQELADLAGVGQDSISAIETGKHEPHPRTLRKLAEVLDVEVADFFREPALSGKAEASETGRLPGWAKTSDLNVLNQKVTEVPSEELRNLVIRLAQNLQWSRTLEDLRSEERSESNARVLNLARINAIADELRRRGEEPPEEYLMAFRQWLIAITPPPEAEPQSGAGRGIPEAG
jgi:transcriptional regulator with XRE-family HTH domain